MDATLPLTHVPTTNNFKPPGGVWRRAAMEAAGGWNTSSTVEDMDLSLRAYVQGWKFK